MRISKQISANQTQQHLKNYIPWQAYGHGHGGGRREWDEWRGGMETYTLSYVKQIAKWNFLYDSGSSNQSSVTTQRDGNGWEKGGRFKRQGIYVYLWLIHADIWQKLTQYCKAIILWLKINKFKKRIIRHDQIWFTQERKSASTEDNRYNIH